MGELVAIYLQNYPQFIIQLRILLTGSIDMHKLSIISLPSYTPVKYQSKQNKCYP